MARVLLVEDEIAVLLFRRRYFQGLGHATLSVAAIRKRLLY